MGGNVRVMNTLRLDAEARRARREHRGVPVGLYVPLRGATSATSLQFGDFVRTQTVTYNAALYEADRDRDGKTGEAAAAKRKKKKRGWKKDHDGDDIPNAIDSDYSTTGDESDGSASGKGKGGAKVARHKASANSQRDDSSDDDGDESKGYREGKIYKTPGGSKEFVVVYKGKIIRFGDPSMENKNDNDERRANFNARHNCADKNDKTKVTHTFVARAPRHAHVTALQSLRRVTLAGGLLGMPCLEAGLQEELRANGARGSALISRYRKNGHQDAKVVLRRGNEQALGSVPRDILQF